VYELTEIENTVHMVDGSQSVSFFHVDCCMDTNIYSAKSAMNVSMPTYNLLYLSVVVACSIFVSCCQ
jgi:hypothetical protein